MFQLGDLGRWLRGAGPRPGCLPVGLRPVAGKEKWQFIWSDVKGEWIWIGEFLHYAPGTLGLREIVAVEMFPSLG